MRLDGVAGHVRILAALMTAAQLAVCSPADSRPPVRQAGTAHPPSDTGAKHERTVEELRADMLSWKRSTDVSPMDDSRTVDWRTLNDFLSPTAPRTLSPSVLHVRCRAGQTELLVATQDVLASGDEVGETPIRLRIDSAPPFTQSWTESTDYRSAFAPQPIALLRRLAHRKRLLVEFRLFQGGAQVADFDLGGPRFGSSRCRVDVPMEMALRRRPSASHIGSVSKLASCSGNSAR